MERTSDNTSSEFDLPIWARSDAFPIAPEGYGWIDRKGISHSCESLEELSTEIRKDCDSAIDLVWTPISPHCQIPEEVDALAEPIIEIRKRWAIEDLQKAKKRLLLLGVGTAILIGYLCLQAMAQLKVIERSNGMSATLLEEAQWLLVEISKSTMAGISLLVFLIFAFIPWYQAQKKQREITKQSAKSKPVIPMIRFETWLHFQNSPVTKFILICISLAFIGQVLVDGSIFTFGNSIQKAGLDKPAYHAGDYWRLLTAPMLHGGALHFAMNALALLYLGKRMENFARWPHLPACFIFSSLIAGEATARLADATSVGASGGLMGWLGFLLVFETLHTRLVPRTSRRRLLAGILMTAIAGLIGYRFIDNAAHFGGLVAGMIYAAIVFPKSTSVARPNTNLADRVVGSISLAVLAFWSVLAMWKIAS